MAERLSLKQGLTAGHGAELTGCIAQSYEGMAHFAATGPRGKTCGDCRNWGDGTGRKQMATERVCVKFARMAGVSSKKVPRTAAACKYFEPQVS